MEQYDVNIFHQPYILMKIIDNLSQKAEWIINRTHYNTNYPSGPFKYTKCHLSDNIEFTKTNHEILIKIKLILSMNYKTISSEIFRDIVRKFKTPYKILCTFHDLLNNHYINENPAIDVVISL
jgi:hypothetical protein